MFDVLGTQVHAVPEPTDRVDQERGRVAAQQLQHADVVAHAATRAVLLFQTLPQLLEPTGSFQSLRTPPWSTAPGRTCKAAR